MCFIQLKRRMNEAFLAKHANDPHCCYCGVETIIVTKSKYKNFPINAATREHIICASKLRGVSAKFNPDNIAVACYRCNSVRKDLVSFEEFKIIVNDPILYNDFIRKHGGFKVKKDRTIEEIQRKEENRMLVIFKLAYTMFIFPEFGNSVNEVLA